LVYYQEFNRIDEAFYRKKQVQGWSRKKKEALINGMTNELKKLAECMNETHYKNYNVELRLRSVPAQLPVEENGLGSDAFDYAQASESKAA
jgi:hypothetical protein